MVTLTSKPINLIVQAASAPVRDWGQGSATGSMAGDVWTPGRDAQGVVNAASWNIVPTGRWIQVAGTRLDSLDAVIKAAIPGWQMYGSWDGALSAWNGLAIDQANNRVWAMNTGGHADSANNGIYEFNGFKMQWLVERLPSDTTKWSSSYKTLSSSGTYTNCPESAARSRSGPINDWFWDEIYWDNPTVPGGSVGDVGVPTSEHTYSGTFYSPNTNELIKCSRSLRLWRYSLATRKYTYKRILNDGNTSNFSGAGALVIFDEVAGIFSRAAAADGLYGTIGYNINTNQWVTPYSQPWSSYRTADARDGRIVTVMSVINSDGANAGQYWRYSLDSKSSTVSGTVKYGGGLSRGSFPTEAPNYYDGPGLCYIPPLNEYWFWHVSTSSGQNNELFKVDPTTTPWTISRKATVGSVPTPSLFHMRKTVWMPSLNAVLCVDVSSKNVYIYKF